MNIGNILICIAGVLWGIELIPQLIKTYNTKKVEDISKLFFSICLLAYVLYGIGNFTLKNWIILIAHIPSFICLSIMLGFLFKYKNKKTIKNKKPEWKNSYLK